MKKFVVAVALMAGIAFSANAQEEKTSNWTLKNVAGANLSQTSLSNWSAGGGELSSLAYLF